MEPLRCDPNPTKALDPIQTVLRSRSAPPPKPVGRSMDKVGKATWAPDPIWGRGTGGGGRTRERTGQERQKKREIRKQERKTCEGHHSFSSLSSLSDPAGDRDRSIDRSERTSEKKKKQVGSLCCLWVSNRIRRMFSNNRSPRGRTERTTPTTSVQRADARRRKTKMKTVPTKLQSNPSTTSLQSAQCTVPSSGLHPSGSSP